MSSPRPGKRPRGAAMEGSTIVIPNKSDNDEEKSSSSIILMLANACAQHLEQHKSEGTEDSVYHHENEIPSSCRKALDMLGRIIPKMEKAYNARRNPLPVDVIHLCDFYLSVTQNYFCPAAQKLFDYGRKPGEMITRVISLLEHVLSPHNRKEFKTQWRRPDLLQHESYLQRLCHTAASLLGIIHPVQLHAYIFQDLVHTVYDLSVLIDSGYFAADGPAPVEIVVFADTLQEVDSSHTSLHLDSLEATKLLQSALLRILPSWTSLHRLKQLESFPDQSEGAVATVPDSALATLLWPDGRWNMSSEISIDLYSTMVDLVRMPTGKLDYREGLRRHAAVQVVQAILRDFQTAGAPELCIVMDLSMAVVQFALDALKMGQYTKVADALADCIQKGISVPPKVDGWSLADSQLAVRRATCPLLLECVPLLSDLTTVHAQKLGTAVLHALAIAFDRPSAGSALLSLADYPRAVDPDVLSALFVLMEECGSAKDDAVWICALVLDGAAETFGSLDVDSTVSKIFDEYNKAKSALEAGNPMPVEKRKRARSDKVTTRKDDSPTKRSRFEVNRSEQTGLRRIDMLQSSIVDLFSLAMFAYNKGWSDATDSVLDGIDCLDPSAVALSGAVQLLLQTQSFRAANGFGSIIEHLSAKLEDLFRSFMSRNTAMPQMARNEVMRVGVHLSKLRDKKDFVEDSTIERLFGWADSIALLKRGTEESSKNLPVNFSLDPLDSDAGLQISRVRVLRYRLKIAPSGPDVSEDAMQMTLELLRDASHRHENAFDRLLFWQVSAWLLHNSTDIERHLRTAGDNRDFGASRVIKFLISTPFSDGDNKLRSYTAGELGRLLVSNPLLRAFLRSTVSNGRTTKQESMLNLSVDLEETRLFKDVDSLLHQHCQIPQSQLLFTIGLSMGNNSDDGNWTFGSVGHQRSAIRSLLSLFDSFFVPSGKSGELIAKGALLRVVRLWVFFGQHKMIEASFFTFGELCRALARTNAVHRNTFLFHTAPATFRDVLFPSSSYFNSSDEGKANPLLDQLENQCQMLYTFVEKFFSVCDFGGFVLSGGPNISEVEESLDVCLPNALAQLVIEKDYDVLRSLTAFKRYVINRHREAKKSKRLSLASNASDLTVGPSVTKSKLWTRDLEEQTMKLCTANDVVDRLLPLLLMHAGPEEDLFFTKRVLMNRLTLPKILQTHGELVLKGLITEFGVSDEAPRQAMWALKRAAVAKALCEDDSVTTLKSSNSRATPNGDSNDNSVSSWVSENFMHLLVNLVQNRWREKSSQEKVQSLRCLRTMLEFLKTAGSSQYLPQVMSTVNASLGVKESDVTKESVEIRFLGIEILDLLVRRVWDDNWETIGDNLTSIVVALIPVLSAVSESLHSGSNREGKSVTRAVCLLQWLTDDSRGAFLKESFKNIPFLPQTPALDPVRASLEKLGLDFNDLRLTMTEGSLSRFSATSDTASTSGDCKSAEMLQKMKINLRDRLHTICRLLGNDNSSIRLHTVHHLILLLQSNRELFHFLVDTEETSTISRFLTVCSKRVSSHGQGVVSELVGTLIDRCALETDRKIRVLLAKAIGEVGAISRRRLHSNGPAEVVSNESDSGYTWRLSRPPWTASPVDYQLCLLTDHLVAALKAAPSSLDHQKIAFTIQEVLALASSTVAEDTNKQNRQPIENDTSTSSGMPDRLQAKLLDAGVLQVVEPFLNSEFCEREPSIPSPPPFFSVSRSYYQWMSTWCRFMIHRSKSKHDSDWNKLLHACRLAMRTHSGLGIAEFLLPIIVLDRICNGSTEDEACVINEMKDALSFQGSLDGQLAMHQNERQKAVNTVFSLISTLRHWSEKDTEDRNRGSSSMRDDSRGKVEGWPTDEAIMSIDDILQKLPLDLQARAAAKAGMHARSLRLLEMASRQSVVKVVFDNASRRGIIPTRSLSSGPCEKESVDLLKDNLVTLGEYETITALSEENLSASAMSKALDGIRQKESSKDWSGALQDYERAHHLLNEPEHGVSLMQGTLNCLLELGQYESVLRQVKGSSVSFDGKQKDSFVPFAVEASWRLGRWGILKDLVNEHEAIDSSNASLPQNVQLEVGQAMLAIKEKDASSALVAVDRAREAVMAPLSTAARESYSRAYSHIVKLHSLRELEDAAPIICNPTIEQDLATFVTDGGGVWKRRLELADPSYTMDLTQPRLALARIVENRGLEAKLFLSIGSRARKDKQYSIAASALAQAEASFDVATKSPSLNADRCFLIIQQAKLKHETGESSASLRLLNMDDIESMLELDDESCEKEMLRRVYAMLPREAELGMNKDKAAEVFRKSALLSTKWMIEGGVKDCSRVIQRFNMIHKVAAGWEKGHFQFAKYIESVLDARVAVLERRSRSQNSKVQDMRQMGLEQDRACHKYLLQAVKHFVMALKIDLKHLFQALPRLLSLWFEFSSLTIDGNNSGGCLSSGPTQASQAHLAPPPAQQDSRRQLSSQLKLRQNELTGYLRKSHTEISSHAFYTALPQLISTIMNSKGDVKLVIQEILSRVLVKHPGQAMWPMAWLRQSEDKRRKEVGDLIFKQAENQLSKMNARDHLKLLVASKSLIGYLQELAKYHVHEEKKSLNIRSPNLEVSLTKFVPPVQAALSPTFAPVESGRKIDPFPRQIPRIKEFCRNVSVMASKARPKKLKAVAVMAQSNPRTKKSSADIVGEFHFLIKQEAKGDLRKDARVQDLNNVINRLLVSSKSTSGSRQHRRLRLRTFAVTCLSEDTGILEWVPHTNSLRNLVTESYNPQVSPFSNRRRGRKMANATDPMIRAAYERKCQEMFFVSGDLKKAAALFDELLLRANPPLLYWWFVQHFQSPHRWYEARTQFTLSAAAWSAVGHVIGLGDRHSENILVDTTCGEMVHVDFDCIFDKGLNLPKPEVVPFRLTPNMIDAFGPVGADGIYTESMKDAMTTLRSNRDTLLSVLEPFIKDPVIDWRRSRTQQKLASEEKQFREAKRSIKVIDERLQGVYNLRNPNLKKIRRTDIQTNSEVDGMSQYLPLSVDGQVHKMISEATSRENLVQLYVGWMPWL